MNLSPGAQIIALRAGEIDIGITNESEREDQVVQRVQQRKRKLQLCSPFQARELLAGEFYTRKLAEMASYIALPEHHRLAT